MSLAWLKLADWLTISESSQDAVGTSQIPSGDGRAVAASTHIRPGSDLCESTTTSAKVSRLSVGSGGLSLS